MGDSLSYTNPTTIAQTRGWLIQSTGLKIFFPNPLLKVRVSQFALTYRPQPLTFIFAMYRVFFPNPLLKVRVSQFALTYRPQPLTFIFAMYRVSTKVLH